MSDNFAVPSFNTPRLIVRPGQLGEWRGLIVRRLPHRITTGER